MIPIPVYRSILSVILGHSITILPACIEVILPLVAYLQTQLTVLNSPLLSAISESTTGFLANIFAAQYGYSVVKSFDTSTMLPTYLLVRHRDNVLLEWVFGPVVHYRIPAEYSIIGLVVAIGTLGFVYEMCRFSVCVFRHALRVGMWALRHILSHTVFCADALSNRGPALIESSCNSRALVLHISSIQIDTMQNRLARMARYEQRGGIGASFHASALTLEPSEMEDNSDMALVLYNPPWWTVPARLIARTVNTEYDEILAEWQWEMDASSWRVYLHHSATRSVKRVLDFASMRLVTPCRTNQVALANAGIDLHDLALFWISELKARNCPMGEKHNIVTDLPSTTKTLVSGLITVADSLDMIEAKKSVFKPLSGSVDDFFAYPSSQSTPPSHEPPQGREALNSACTETDQRGTIANVLRKAKSQEDLRLLRESIRTRTDPTDEVPSEVETYDMHALEGNSLHIQNLANTGHLIPTETFEEYRRNSAKPEVIIKNGRARDPNRRGKAESRRQEMPFIDNMIHHPYPVILTSPHSRPSTDRPSPRSRQRREAEASQLEYERMAAEVLQLYNRSVLVPAHPYQSLSLEPWHYNAFGLPEQPQAAFYPHPHHPQEQLLRHLRSGQADPRQWQQPQCWLPEEQEQYPSHQYQFFGDHQYHQHPFPHYTPPHAGPSTWQT